MSVSSVTIDRSVHSAECEKHHAEDRLDDGCRDGVCIVTVRPMTPTRPISGRKTEVDSNEADSDARWQRLDAATAHLSAPLAAIDVAALGANADDLVRRSGGLPIRIATKSVRCRAVLEWAGARAGFAGLMAYALPEAIWLARTGAQDILVAYPSVDLPALAALAADPELRQTITLMVDHPDHLRLIQQQSGGGQVRVCIDVDASLRLGPVHLGVRRSPVHDVGHVLALLDQVEQYSSITVVGLMFYEAQVAGVPDASLAIRAMKRRSLAELANRRTSIIQAVRERIELSFVNAGGTGSLHHVASDPALTEVTAGSGLFGPTLFDHYRGFTPQPALGYALPVTRAPAPGIRTVFSGGYLASGAVGPSRVPTPVWPSGLRLLRAEGVGEVQTPVMGTGAAGLRIGDRVWWRPAKAGETCERFAELALVDTAAESVTVQPTYRGEGRCFG